MGLKNSITIYPKRKEKPRYVACRDCGRVKLFCWKKGHRIRKTRDKEAS